VLESQGFEYIALDLDPARIRAARQAGTRSCSATRRTRSCSAKSGCGPPARSSSVSRSATSIGILHSVRRLRPEVPVLVRTQDDARIKELQDAGATDVVRKPSKQVSCWSRTY